MRLHPAARERPAVRVAEELEQQPEGAAARGRRRQPGVHRGPRQPRRRAARRRRRGRGRAPRPRRACAASARAGRGAATRRSAPGPRTGGSGERIVRARRSPCGASCSTSCVHARPAPGAARSRRRPSRRRRGAVTIEVPSSKGWAMTCGPAAPTPGRRPRARARGSRARRRSSARSRRSGRARTRAASPRSRTSRRRAAARARARRRPRPPPARWTAQTRPL